MSETLIERLKRILMCTDRHYTFGMRLSGVKSKRDQVHTGVTVLFNTYRQRHRFCELHCIEPGYKNGDLDGTCKGGLKLKFRCPSHVSYSDGDADQGAWQNLITS